MTFSVVFMGKSGFHFGGGGGGQRSPPKTRGGGAGKRAALTYTIVTIEKKLTIHLWQGLCTSDFIPLLGTPRQWGDVAILPTCGP